DGVGNREGTPGAAQATTTADASAPTSSVVALPAFTGSADFTVSWSGSDGSSSGIAGYDVYVSDNGAAFTAFQTATTQKSAPFTGGADPPYDSSRGAADNAGLRQPTPTDAQARITVDITPPTSSVVALPAIRPGSFTVSWSGSDDGSGS